MSLVQCRGGLHASRVRAPARACPRTPCKNHGSRTRCMRTTLVAKAGEAPRTVEDILNEANQLLSSIVENGSAAAPAAAVAANEASSEPADGGNSTSALSRSLSGDSWSIEIASNASASFPASISGPNWTLSLSHEELKDILEAILSARNVVKNLHDQGDWHASLQSSAQWRVNAVLAKASYAAATSQEAAEFDLTITLDPKGKRPVCARWPASTAASMLNALDAELRSSTAETAVTSGTA